MKDTQSLINKNVYETFVAAHPTLVAGSQSGAFIIRSNQPDLSLKSGIPIHGFMTTKEFIGSSKNSSDTICYACEVKGHRRGGESCKIPSYVTKKRKSASKEKLDFALAERILIIFQRPPRHSTTKFCLNSHQFSLLSD